MTNSIILVETNIIMEKQQIKECTSFIKARIKESFFKEETETLHKGLKLMKISLDKYLQITIEGFIKDEPVTDTFPEINVLNLPKLPIVKKVINKMSTLSKTEEVIMEDFAAVNLTLAFISFEYFRVSGEKEFALEYANYLIKNIDKLKSRIGGDVPTYIKEFYKNMSREAKLLEEENKKTGTYDNHQITQEELNRIHDSLHYLKINNNKTTPLLQKSVHRIHFEDFSGEQFERLVFAYVLRYKIWDKPPEWLGQAGSDSGRDIWAIHNSEAYCYACANYQNLTITKAKSDIDKLKKNKHIPTHLFIVCGGVVSANLRDKITVYGKKAGVEETSVWTGVEFEEKLRYEAPELIKRFFEGEDFPDSPSELIKYTDLISVSSDVEVINLLMECFDRPAFTTRFEREASIPNFNKAIDDTIEALNTGVHRLRDGTVIRTIPSRHKIKDAKLKSELGVLTQLVIELRDNFTELNKKREIEPCSCDQDNCATYSLSPNACKLMDESRKKIFSQLKKIKPDFNLKLY